MTNSKSFQSNWHAYSFDKCEPNSAIMCTAVAFKLLEHQNHQKGLAKCRLLASLLASDSVGLSWALKFAFLNIPR
jgi:hypothetical protein